jgi:citrate synthase
LTSALAHYDPDASDGSPQANYHKAVRLTSQLSSLVATMGRVSAGGAPIAPDPVLGHAANFLYMLTGDRPSALATRAFDVALILHADHELNASTFAARVIAATLSDLHSAVVGAIGALKGPLHGGANADVMRMLLEVGKDGPAEKAEELVRAKLARKEKIAGFGHRVYHTEDPRATHLREMSRDLGQRAGQPIWFEMSQRIEALVKAEKKLNPNVDFYSASTYHALGIPVDLFTPIFAVSRISGWTAHALEQYANNRLIRPRAEYIGPAYPQRYTPLEQR